MKKVTINGYTVWAWYAGFPEFSVEKDGVEVVRTFRIGDVAAFLGMPWEAVSDEIYTKGEEVC